MNLLLAHYVWALRGTFLDPPPPLYHKQGVLQPLAHKVLANGQWRLVCGFQREIKTNIRDYGLNYARNFCRYQGSRTSDIC